jgi:hypothetical protein
MTTFAPFVGLNYHQDLRRRGKNIQIFTWLNRYSRKKQLIVKDPFLTRGIYVLTALTNKLYPAAVPSYIVVFFYWLQLL